MGNSKVTQKIQFLLKKNTFSFDLFFTHYCITYVCYNSIASFFLVEVIKLAIHTMFYLRIKMIYNVFFAYRRFVVIIIALTANVQFEIHLWNYAI